MLPVVKFRPLTQYSRNSRDFDSGYTLHSIRQHLCYTLIRALLGSSQILLTRHSWMYVNVDRRSLCSFTALLHYVMSRVYNPRVNVICDNDVTPSLRSIQGYMLHDQLQTNNRAVFTIHIGTNWASLQHHHHLHSAAAENWHKIRGWEGVSKKSRSKT